LQASVQRTNDPWQAAEQVRQARRVEYKEASGPLDGLLRDAEAACLGGVLKELTQTLERRQWVSARKLIKDSLDKLPTVNVGGAREVLLQVVGLCRQADRLDRLAVALHKTRTGGGSLDAWQRVPIHRLPSTLKDLARGQRGLLSLHEEAAADWRTAPDLATLKSILEEFRAGNWSPGLAGRIQFRLSVKAFDRGHGPLARSLLEGLEGPGVKVPAEDVKAAVRNMKKAPRAEVAWDKVPPADNIRFLFPLVNVPDFQPSSARSPRTLLNATATSQGPEPASALSPLALLPALEIAKKEAAAAATVLRQRLANESRQVRQELIQAGNKVHQYARGPLPALLSRGATASGSGGSGGSGGPGGDPPGLVAIILPVYTGDEDRDRDNLLSRVSRSLGSELSSEQVRLVSSLWRQGEGEEDIVALLKIQAK
jgi:hypothetical protein